MDVPPVWRDLLPHVVDAVGAACAGTGLYGIGLFITWMTALYGDDKRSKRAMRLLKRPPVDPEDLAGHQSDEDRGQLAVGPDSASAPSGTLRLPPPRLGDTGADRDHDGGGQAVA